MSITELSLDPSNVPIRTQLDNLIDHRDHCIDLTQAPLTRFFVTKDTDNRWMAVQLMHHIIGDHSTLDVMMYEIQVMLNGRSSSLMVPQPFRNLVFQARSGLGVEAHQAFFTNMLSEIDTPALPFGLSDVHHDGLDSTESQLALPHDLNSSLRGHAKRMG
ncbi:hypothetical protein BGZ79_006111, partial [Entomortierella chlamydospora]